jgi:hypothetical protein
LTLLFFGTSATLFKTRTRWRASYEEYKRTTAADLKEVKDQLTKLTGQIDEKDKMLNADRKDKNQLSEVNKQLKSDITSEQGKVKAAESAREKSETLSQQIAKNLEAETQRSQQVAKERDDAKAKQDEALKQLADAITRADSLTLDLATNQKDLSESKKALEQLSQKAEELQVQVAYVKEKYPWITWGPVIAPKIDALVSAVDEGEKLVVLSVGKNLNVEPGYHFTVARGNEFVGKVEVIRVYPALSGARILFTKDGQQIQRGDKAFTTND